MIVCIMAVYALPFWKPAPFVRLLIPFVLGIIIGYYVTVPLLLCWIVVGLCFLISLAWNFVPLHIRFSGNNIPGFILQLLVLAIGLLITAMKDVSPTLAQINKKCNDRSRWLVRVNEDPIEKKASWKAEASVVQIRSGTAVIAPSVKILLYFRKPLEKTLPVEGDLIGFIGKPAPIMHTPGPGNFDYRAYCALQNIHYQIFLQTRQFFLTGVKRITRLELLINHIEKHVTGWLRKYIPGKRESGLAEALLIGYKNDLDKALVNSYAATGVVHVIAISGLHLGFIYLILKKCTAIFGRKHSAKWASAFFILAGLWLFSLLAGASPSVLRSAVMLSSLVAGEIFHRRSGMMNGLAASAFILLWHNPYWLWDVGFQLSYAALTGIMIFMKPIYQTLSIKWKLLDEVWKLNAVTLSAQVLTASLSLYYFQQFPLLFLVTNFVAVPLSSIVLAGEIVICLVAFMPSLAAMIGKCVALLIYGMNEAISFFGRLPYATVRQFRVELPQVYISYVFIFFLSPWLVRKDKRFLPPALISAIFFFIAGW